MGRQKQTGFTVVEVVLVLAISGLIMMGIMGNAFRKVNDQNYRDGVESFKDIIAGQLEDIDALKNEQQGGCSVGSTASPGMGDCFYSGKLMHITFDAAKDASVVTTYPVQSAATIVGGVEQVDWVRKVEADSNVSHTNVPWGVQVYSKEPTRMRLNDFYILAFRSPVTGVAMTHFFTNSINANDSNRLKSIAMNEGAIGEVIDRDYVFCLADPNNVDAHDRWLAVKMEKNVAKPSSLTMIGGGECV